LKMKSLFLLALIPLSFVVTASIIFIPVYASSFDDGFNAGKAAADRDATALEEGTKNSVDANHVKCPSKHDDEFCRGYKQGYSDEAQARLE
jgi:hypothetical protein